MIYADATDAMSALQTFIQTQLDNDNSFATYGGAQVVSKTTEARLEESIGVPCIVLDIESDADSRWAGGTDLARDAVIKTECRASDWNGAQVGAANPVGADVLLSRALARIVWDKRAEINALGLEIVSYRGESQDIKTDADSGGEMHNNRGRIAFTYWRN